MLCSCHSKPKFKYGIEIPQNYEDILQIDKTNGKNAWKDALKVEMDYRNLYKVLEDTGKGTAAPK